MINGSLTRREWLVRYIFEDDELAVCSVEADNGRIVVYCPDDNHFVLSGEWSLAFAEAVQGALRTAEDDRATARGQRARSAAGASSGTAGCAGGTGASRS